MLKAIKRNYLKLGDRLGVFHLVGKSRWRRDRLLILCYHGIARDEEHLWRPPLYMTPSRFRERMELLREGGYNVLPLGEAIERMYAGDLPERSVAITFDDGGYDFYAEAYPVLESYGFPATVYLTTYYCDHPVPIFHLMCSYLLWKRRDGKVDLRTVTGSDAVVDLRSGRDRQQLARGLVDFARRNGLTAEDKNRLAGTLADALNLDYGALLEKRVLQLMNPAEVSEMAAKGVDIQLHTHRHRSPHDKALYQKELRDNRASIERIVDSSPRHFCYPSGRYRAEFLPWLREEKVVSATTCDPGIATPRSDPLLLPRLVDVESLSLTEFRGWLTGVSSHLPQREKHRADAD